MTQESVYIQLRRDSDVSQFERAAEEVADRRGTDVEELSQVAVVSEALRAYLEGQRCRQFRRLKDDQRIQEARHAVAQDHGMDAGDVSLEALLKITCSAYCGYQQTSDWEVQKIGEKA